jgi:outer membrane protein TolC
MMLFRKILTLLLFCLGATLSLAQEDSIHVMTYEEFIARVKEHHPMARQANIQVEKGDAYVTKERGNFDPKLNGDAAQKYYKGDQYYSVLGAGLKIPTWYGISFQGGYDLNGGTQLNPERYVPDDGLWYAGVNVSLGRGLIIDERRAALKKAKIYRDASIQAQRIMMNDLILDASYAYWSWFKSYNKFVVYAQAVENATIRFNSVKESAVLGDKAPMDTLESSLQLQNRLFNYMDAELDFLNATEYLSIFLWESGFIPLEIDSATYPPILEGVKIAEIAPETILQMDSIRANHPEIMKTQYMIDQRKVDLQLSRNNLLPIMNFKYNAIANSDGTNPINNYSLNNYTWGADFSFPIFIRKQRGQLRLDKLELENLEAGMSFKIEQVGFKIETAYNQWSTTVQQIELWQKTTQDYLQLLQYEQTLFQIGESSLFMVNSREKNYINAQLKLVETLTKNQLAAIKTNYAMGLLF